MGTPTDRSFQVAQEAAPQLKPAEPALVVEKLTADYTTVAGTRVRALDGISLAIKHGETVGVAGRSGCGKTTWLRVLLRLTHACSGKVFLGGVPLEAVSRRDIGRLIGYVGQTPFVFSDTIANNIGYGVEHATPEDIRRAAELASLHDEILQLPNGYEAQVTERGQNLSGGQRQRLALARVLLKRPAIVILDEATSALDNTSERQIQRSLNMTAGDRTTILVAHRLTTLVNTDRILVFDGGRIVEEGTYDELLRRGGLFAKLALAGENDGMPIAALT
jgi:ATP-binding cassette subfamily B protein